MTNNIIIAGVPRAGKTTLSRLLMNHGWTHISMDAIIAGFEQCFPETGVSTYQGLSSMDTLSIISGKMAPFIRAMIESEYSGYIVEQSRLLKSQCETYGLPYRDTSYDREAVFNEIIAELMKKELEA